MIRPELLLLGSALGRFRCLLGLGMDIAQGKVPKDQFDRLLVFLQQLLERGLYPPTIGTLKVGEFDDGHRSVLRAKERIIIGSYVNGWGLQVNSDRVALPQFA